MLYQVLEVVRNGKNSIFLLIFLNLSPNQSPFNQYYPKSVPNPDILIILLQQNIKIVVLTNIPISKQCKSVTLNALVGQTLDLVFFQT